MTTRQVIPEKPGAGRLGRHVAHDARSWLYPAPMAAAIKTVQHQRHCPPFDQGDLGSCTGNAIAGLLMTEPFWEAGRVMREADAVNIYSAATRVDRVRGVYPPDDTGSSGLAVAKAARNMKLISGYRHAFGLNAALHALTLAPVIVGIEWLEGFDHPRFDGRLVLTGNVRGGHEVVLDGVDAESHRVWGTNSWGDWGPLHGRFWWSWDDFGALLDRQGDVTTVTV
jgi:hypothetical protein